jgi:heterotetrameric sarcosine oxidase gamma subunit
MLEPVTTHEERSGTSCPPVQIGLLHRRTTFRVKTYRTGMEDDGLVRLAGCRLPPIGRTTSIPWHSLGIGPGDWLIFPPERLADKLRTRVLSAPDATGLIAIELTDALVTLQVRGPLAPQILSMDCGLDWHEQRFAVGSCARTRLANIPVIIAKLDGLPSFELTIGRSHLGYLHAYLTDAISSS